LDLEIRIKAYNSKIKKPYCSNWNSI